jgi:hypothetical protein
VWEKEDSAQRGRRAVTHAPGGCRAAHALEEQGAAAAALQGQPLLFFVAERAFI